MVQMRVSPKVKMAPCTCIWYIWCIWCTWLYYYVLLGYKSYQVILGITWLYLVYLAKRKC